MKFLIVEDNPKMRSFIKKIVEQNIKSIKTIYECDNGEDAVQLSKKHHLDWILMDIQLKNMDGLTATKLIRNFDLAAKIIIVTQYDDAEYRKITKDIGVIDYVLKDNLYDLIEIIQSHL
jgi:DNA-binding NarL/FixJ family response regulator